MTRKRLQYERKCIRRDYPLGPRGEELFRDGFSLNPVDDDLSQWEARIRLDPESVFSNYLLILSIRTTSGYYPFSPPKLHFKTKIYHPNISEGGEVCMDILTDAWGPILTLTKVVLSTMSLLNAPDLDEPMNVESAILYSTDRLKYKAKVMEWLRDSGATIPLLTTKEHGFLPNSVYLYTRPAGIPGMLPISGGKAFSKIPTQQVRDWTRSNPIKVFSSIDNSDAHPRLHHWGVWACGALFELGVQADKVSLYTLKHEDVPGGYYYRICELGTTIPKASIRRLKGYILEYLEHGIITIPDEDLPTEGGSYTAHEIHPHGKPICDFKGMCSELRKFLMWPGTCMCPMLQKYRDGYHECPSQAGMKASAEGYAELCTEHILDTYNRLRVDLIAKECMSKRPPTYNLLNNSCQDYVLELIPKLGGEGVTLDDLQKNTLKSLLSCVFSLLDGPGEVADVEVGSPRWEEILIPGGFPAAHNNPEMV